MISGLDSGLGGYKGQQVEKSDAMPQGRPESQADIKFPPSNLGCPSKKHTNKTTNINSIERNTPWKK